MHSTRTHLITWTPSNVNISHSLSPIFLWKNLKSHFAFFLPSSSLSVPLSPSSQSFPTKAYLKVNLNSSLTLKCMSTSSLSSSLNPDIVSTRGRLSSVVGRLFLLPRWKPLPLPRLVPAVWEPLVERAPLPRPLPPGSRPSDCAWKVENCKD